MGQRTRRHSHWRLDQDYLDRLSLADRQWVEKFNAEYYRAEFSDKPLHSPRQRREIWRAQYAADCDILTAAPETVKASTDKIHGVRRRDIRLASRYYSPDDYPQVIDMEEYSHLKKARKSA